MKKNHIDMTQIDVGLGTDTNILNKKFVRVWLYLFKLSST